jgi:hypothetical protein
MPIEDLARDDVVTATPDTLVEIVTADDLTELLADEHQQFASVVQAQRPAY